MCFTNGKNENQWQLSPGGGLLARHRLKNSLVCFLFCFLRVSRILNIPVGVRSFHSVKIWAARGEKLGTLNLLSFIKFSVVKWQLLGKPCVSQWQSKLPVKNVCFQTKWKEFAACFLASLLLLLLLFFFPFSFSENISLPYLSELPMIEEAWSLMREQEPHVKQSLTHSCLAGKSNFNSLHMRMPCEEF